MPVITDNQTVNGNAGDWVDVTPTIHARRAVFDEDPTYGAAAGIDYILPKRVNGDIVFDPATTRTLDAGAQLTFGDSVANSNNQGEIVGTPGYSSGGNTVPATVIAKVRSHTANPTKYRLSETE